MILRHSKKLWSILVRIISSFKDYYDSAMGYGIDHDLIWLRESKEVKEDIGPRRKYQWSNYWFSNNFHYINVNIGFCGKLYGCTKVSKKDDGKVLAEAICHSVEDIDNFIESNFKKKQIKYYYDRKGSWRNNLDMGLNGRRANFEKFFKDVAEYSDDKVEKFLIKNNTPVVVGNTLNASLKKWEFYRVVDPYTAFQEIQMFFGKLRSPEKPIPPISDADMLEAKGFDPKYSFRKEPNKKKKKKKK